MKRFNIAGIIWKLSIILILIVILIAVMDYKIHFEYLTNNNLYFYDCDGTLCVTEVKNDNHLLYSKYQCGYEECPIFKSELNDNFVILTEKNNSILFNYRTGQITSTNYTNYQLLNNNYIIVTKDKYQGIIDLNNNLIVPTNYEQLGIIKENYLTGYTINSIIAKKDNKYGMISIKDGTIIVEFNYEENELDNLLQILKDETNSTLTD